MSGSRWLEVLVITAAAPVVGSLVAPGDAYLLRAPFPWLVLAPLLVALQHGLWAGLCSSALLSSGALWYVMAVAAVPATTLASWSMGSVLVAIIAGQLRDSARARSQNLEQRSEELQDRLERSERSRHLIQLSHAKLVERVAASRSSLVAAIEGAQRRMSDAHSMHELGKVLLDALASQGNLHAASAYITGRDHKFLVTQPVASFGASGASSARHPLVVRAFETGRLAAIAPASDKNPRDRSVLAAVPLITSARKVVGVVAVHEMPFMAFQTEHLQQLFVLAGHLADMLFDRWSALHDAPLAVVPAELPAAESGASLRQVTEEHMRNRTPTQRTWRGMPAVQLEPLTENILSAEQPEPAVAEEPSMKLTVTPGIVLPPPARPKPATVEAPLPAPEPARGDATGTFVKGEAVAVPVEEQPAEEPVSDTVLIATPRSERISTLPPPPDPNRIAALIRGAVRKAPVKGVAIGAIKPKSVSRALRERVRAIAQTRTESSR